MKQLIPVSYWVLCTWSNAMLQNFSLREGETKSQRIHRRVSLPRLHIWQSSGQYTLGHNLQTTGNTSSTRTEILKIKPVILFFYLFIWKYQNQQWVLVGSQPLAKWFWLKEQIFKKKNSSHIYSISFCIFKKRLSHYLKQLGTIVFTKSYSNRSKKCFSAAG